MTTAEFLSDQLRRAHEGNAWHGPALRETLTGVDAAMASARPVPGAHTIAEIVRHIGAWLTAVGRRLRGEVVTLSGTSDWPPQDPSDEAWQETLLALDRETEALQRAISNLPEEALKNGVPGCDYSLHFLLEGVIQHHLYHAGQIAILKLVRPKS